MERGVNLLSCIAILGMIIWSIKAIKQQGDEKIRWGCECLLIVTALRYIIEIGYIMEMNEMWLKTLRPVFEVGVITIGLLSAISMWYALPCLREGIKLSYYIGCFLPWYGLGLYGIILQPTLLVAQSGRGYEVMIQAKYAMYYQMLQYSFIGVIGLIGIVGLMKYKHLQIRTQISVILMAQGLWAFETVNIGKADLLMVRSSRMAELLMIWAAGFGLSRMVRSHKKITS